MIALHPDMRAFMSRLRAAKLPGERLRVMRDAIQHGVGISNVDQFAERADATAPGLIYFHVYETEGVGQTPDEAVRSWLKAAEARVALHDETGLDAARRDFAHLQAHLPLIAMRRRVSLQRLIAECIQTLAEGMHNCAPTETDALLDLVKERMDGIEEDDTLDALCDAIFARTEASALREALG